MAYLSPDTVTRIEGAVSPSLQRRGSTAAAEPQDAAALLAQQRQQRDRAQRVHDALFAREKSRQMVMGHLAAAYQAAHEHMSAKGAGGE